MGKAVNKKTHEYFVLELIGKGIFYEPLDRYVDSKTKIRFKCDKCGNIWKASPTNILSGKGCAQCKKTNAKLRFQMGKDEFLRKVSDASPNIKILETDDYTYRGESLATCTVHGITWRVLNATLIKGCGCKQCGIEKTRKKRARTQEDFEREVSLVSPHIEVLGKYINARTKIKVRCRLHDETYLVTPDLVLNGTGNCAKCTMTSGEYKVANYLDSKGYKYITQHMFKDNKEISNKRFDFYIPSINTCIEYDGIQHYEPVFNFGGENTFKYTKKNDAIKNKYCKDKKINLIRVPYVVNDIGDYLMQYGV